MDKNLGLILLVGAGIWLWFSSRKPAVAAPAVAAPAVAAPAVAAPAAAPTTVKEIYVVTGRAPLDVYDWNRLNPSNPIEKTPETTYVGVSPAVDFEQAIKTATAQAAETGKPTLMPGGYYIDADEQWIKGAGW